MRRFLALLLLLVALTLFADCTPATALIQHSSTAGQSNKGNPSVKVWVNTNSSVYHCPGTRWYGATKQGEYMTQKEALEKGNRPAYGKYCQ
jgi:hypothetical protein